MPLGIRARFAVTCCLTWLACATLAARPPQSAAPTTPSSQPKAYAGAISGTVTDGATGRPLAGVVVGMYGGQAISTITDSKGRFVFRNLPPSEQYGLTATKPGYVPGGLVWMILGSQGSRFPLGDGEWISNADFVMWRLGGISGTVVDERGEPIVGVPVQVLLRLPIAGEMQLATGPAARTDDRGVYRIAGLRRGSYMVTVLSVQSSAPLSTPVEALITWREKSANANAPPPKWLGVGNTRLIVGRYATPPPAAPDRAPRAYPIAFYPNARTLANATPIELADGQEKRGIDFALQPVPTATVSGRLTGPADVIAGLVLRLLPEGSESLGMSNEQATAVAGSDGAFTFLAVPAGRYTIDARKSVSGIRTSGWVTGDFPPPTPGLADGHFAFETFPSMFGRALLETSNYTASGLNYAARLSVTVGTADLTDIVVPLERPSTISGRIVSDDGSPLPAALRASVQPANGSPDLGGPAGPPGNVDSTGRFSIDGLQHGEYFLSAWWQLVKSIAAPDGDHTRRPFDVTPGADITDVVVTVTDKQAKLTGEVRDRQGRAVTEAAVIAFPTDPERWTRFGLSPQWINSASYFGSRGFQLTRLPGGEYYVIAVKTDLRNAWMEPGFLAAAAPLATRVTLDWGQTLAVTLTLREVTVK